MMVGSRSRKYGAGTWLARAALMAAAAGSVFPARGMAQLPQQGALDLEKGDIAVALDRTAYLAGEPAQLAVRLTIEEGWHTNSFQPTYDYLIATEIEVEVPPDWLAPETPRYPPGEMKRFAFAPTAISVYEGEIFIRTALPTPAGAAAGTYPVRTSVTYQACDDKMCLAPVTTPATVGLTVAAGGEAREPRVLRLGGNVHGQPGSADRGCRTGLPVVRAPGFPGRADFERDAVCTARAVAQGVRADEERRGGQAGRSRRGALATAAGIILSFLLLAGAAIGARARPASPWAGASSSRSRSSWARSRWSSSSSR